MIAREVLDKAIKEWLQTTVGKSVGLVSPPDSLTLPYVILYPITSTSGPGSFADPEEDRDYVYQATCVGQDPRQTAWMSRKVQAAFTERLNSDYLYPIAVSGIEIQWRLCDELGGIVPGGDDIFQSADTYRVRVGK